MSAGALPAISSPRLATLSFVRSVFVCSWWLRACACTWLEKPEPLLESGHDLAVTHGNRDGGGREREAGRRQQQQPRRRKTSAGLRHLGAGERPDGRLSLRSATSSRSADCCLQEPRDVVEGRPPSPPKLSSTAAHSKYKAG